MAPYTHNPQVLYPAGVRLVIHVNGEREVQCNSALVGHDRLIARALFKVSSDDSLNQGNISLLQRIDLLDNILSTMEDKAPIEPSNNSFRSPHGSRRISTPPSLEKRCKSTESVLEEVEEKGTLVERVSELEKRIIKLQRMISTKAGDHLVHPGMVEASAHSIPHHDQASSHHDEHEQSLQDVADVEKHEVTSVPLEYEHQHEPHFTHSDENLNISPRKEEPLSHMESHQGMISSEGASMEREDPRARRQQSKNKSQRIKKWLSKRLHLGSSTRKGKHICSTGHCWSSHTHPKSCWSLKRDGPYASSSYRHYAQKSIDEDSS